MMASGIGTYGKIRFIFLHAGRPCLAFRKTRSATSPRNGSGAFTKLLTDGVGQRIGEQLLVGVAKRLEKCLRATDMVSRVGRDFIVARLGRDEVTVLLYSSKDHADAKQAAERLMKSVAATFMLEVKE